MNVLKEYTKPPGGRLNYGIDWKDDLEPGETIAESKWIFDPPTGLTFLGSYIVKGQQAIFWVSGGQEGEVYTATSHVTTTKVDPTSGLPRVDERSIRIFVRAR